MRILITGNRGYIGWILTQKLLDLGHTVVGVDLGWYEEYVYSYQNKGLRGVIQYTMDYNDIDYKFIKSNDIETVIHLAAYSNDPLGEIDKGKTYENNYINTIHFINICKRSGVRHFVFSSSCSVYGKNEDKVNEYDKTDPLTTYAKGKLFVENYLKLVADERFVCTVMRNSTVYGYSPSMRMDLVVNNLSGHAHFNKKVKILSDGTPCRPLIHVQDVANAFIHCMYFRYDNRYNEVYYYRMLNVGVSHGNVNIHTIGKHISDIYRVPISIGDNDPDSRSYNVDFRKFDEYTSFVKKFTLIQGIEELKLFLESGEMKEDRFVFKSSRLNQLGDK